MLLAYLAVTGLMVWAAPASPLQAGCAAWSTSPWRPTRSAASLRAGCRASPSSCARGSTAAPSWGVLVSSYLTLRDFLFLVRPDALRRDGWSRLDLRLFGVEPALWLERYNQRPIVEWFSFFYFSYFFICTAYMVTVVWLTPLGRRTAEFSIGTLIVFTIGQLATRRCPATGPSSTSVTSSTARSPAGSSGRCVWNTVKAGGAMKDIFPSLHTAVPLWFTLFALHQARTDPRWRWAGAHHRLLFHEHHHLDDAPPLALRHRRGRRPHPGGHAGILTPPARRPRGVVGGARWASRAPGSSRPTRTRATRGSGSVACETVLQGLSRKRQTKALAGPASRLVPRSPPSVRAFRGSRPAARAGHPSCDVAAVTLPIPYPIPAPLAAHPISLQRVEKLEGRRRAATPLAGQRSGGAPRCPLLPGVAAG